MSTLQFSNKASKFAYYNENQEEENSGEEEIEEERQEEGEVLWPSHHCFNTTEEDLSSVSHQKDRVKETHSARIKICWFEEFSRLAQTEKPEDMQTLTYLQDF